MGVHGGLPPTFRHKVSSIYFTPKSSTEVCFYPPPNISILVVRLVGCSALHAEYVLYVFCVLSFHMCGLVRVVCGCVWLLCVSVCVVGWLVWWGWMGE